MRPSVKDPEKLHKDCLLVPLVGPGMVSPDTYRKRVTVGPALCMERLRGFGGAIVLL